MGLHRAVCVDVEDLGVVDSNFGPKHIVKVYWQTEKANHEGKRYVLSKRYTASLHEKANLRIDLKNWRSKDFTAEELKGFDLERLLGANCQINVIHNTKEVDGETVTFANVSSIVPPPTGVERLQALNYTRRVDRDQQATEFPPPDSTEQPPPAVDEDPGEYSMEF
jgi:hypothetical protein